MNNAVSTHPTKLTERTEMRLAGFVGLHTTKPLRGVRQPLKSGIRQGKMGSLAGGRGRANNAGEHSGCSGSLKIHGMKIN